MKTPTTRQLRGRLLRGLGAASALGSCGALLVLANTTTVHTCGLPAHRAGRHCCGTWLADGTRRCGRAWEDHGDPHLRVEVRRPRRAEVVSPKKGGTVVTKKDKPKKKPKSPMPYGPKY